MRSREKRNLVSSKDEKKQHRVRVLLGERCVRTNANAVLDWGKLLLGCVIYKMPRAAKRDEF